MNFGNPGQCADVIGITVRRVDKPGDILCVGPGRDEQEFYTLRERFMSFRDPVEAFVDVHLSAFFIVAKSSVNHQLPSNSRICFTA